MGKVNRKTTPSIMGRLTGWAPSLGGRVYREMQKGDDPPAPPEIPEAPTPELKMEEMIDVIDEIAGVQSIFTTGADGKKQRVISRLPRTPEEDQFYSQAGTLISSALGNLNALYQREPEAIADYQPVINAFASLDDERIRDLSTVGNLGNIEQEIDSFRQIQNNLVNEEIRRINIDQENNLAQRGHFSSSAGNDLRAQLAREEVLARQQADLNARAYGEDLADQRLNRQLQGYGLRETDRQQRLSQAVTANDLKRQRIADSNAQTQSLINNNLAQLQTGLNLRGIDQNVAMGSQAPGLALDQFNAQQNAINQNYNNALNRANLTYGQQLEQFNARGPTAQQSAANLGVGLLGMYLGGWAGAAGMATGGARSKANANRTPQRSRTSTGAPYINWQQNRI
ncbi:MULTISPECIES: hypothetical protein [Cysteiniphilum]|uniref:hypothetical protein n=1 Tax=Cysteiniphilum TaxID=2056696 RepID=UPI00177E3EB4|nr:MULTISPECIES: hypothetical protein [Cysteiniphilum]